MSETSEPAKPAAAYALVGAASPLWGYFAGAAAAGVAFWWLTRPLKRENLEALLAAGEQADLPALEVAAEVPFVPTAEAVSSEASGDGAAPAPLPVANPREMA